MDKQIFPYVFIGLIILLPMVLVLFSISFANDRQRDDRAVKTWKNRLDESVTLKVDPAKLRSVNLSFFAVGVLMCLLAFALGYFIETGLGYCAAFVGLFVVVKSLWAKPVLRRWNDIVTAEISASAIVVQRSSGASELISFNSLQDVRWCTPAFRAGALQQIGMKWKESVSDNTKTTHIFATTDAQRKHSNIDLIIPDIFSHDYANLFAIISSRFAAQQGRTLVL